MGKQLRLRTCSLCTTKFTDTTPSYCRPCTNGYYRWRYEQNQKGLSAPIAEYRKVVAQRARQTPSVADEAVPFKECPICYGIHRNPHSAYCTSCKTGYQAWARRQREAYAMSNGLAGIERPTVEEYRCMVFDITEP